MYELDLDAIKARAAIRPGALLAALRCVPDGEIRHGCVISDGQRTKDAIRTAYHVVHKDTPALIAEVERLRDELARQSRYAEVLRAAVNTLHAVDRPGDEHG